MDNGDIVSVKGVAKYLRLSEATIYKLVRKRKLPYFKVGGSIRFRLSDINDLFGSVGNKYEME